MALRCVDFQRFLASNYQDNTVAVEFECGGLCKKAVGVLRCVAPDFIRLVRHGTGPSDFVKITIFYGNECPIEECAEEIVIKKCKITSIEFRPEFGECPSAVTAG